MVHPLPLPPIKPVLIPLEHAVVRPLVRARIAARNLKFAKLPPPSASIAHTRA